MGIDGHYEMSQTTFSNKVNAVELGRTGNLGSWKNSDNLRSIV